MSARIKLVAALAAMVAVAAPTTSEAQSSSAAATVDVNRQGAPGSYGAFVAALNTQAMHRQRLARISNLTPAEVTVSDVSTIGGPDNTTAMDNAITRRASATTATRRALSGNSVVAGVLSAAGIDMSRVLAITVRGHELRDVTVFYR
jgi:hypothetical protein